MQVEPEALRRLLGRACMASAKRASRAAWSGVRSGSPATAM